MSQPLAKPSRFSRWGNAATSALSATTAFVSSRDYSSIVGIVGAAASDAKPRTTHSNPSDGKKECLSIFPAAAVLRQTDVKEPVIDFILSGQAYVLQPASEANRSQRVFLRLARRLAGNPVEGSPQYRRFTERILPFIAMALVSRTVQITVFSCDEDDAGVELFSIGVRTDFDGLIPPQRIEIRCAEIGLIPHKIRLESHLVPQSIIPDSPGNVFVPTAKTTRGNSVVMNVGSEFGVRIITDVDDTCKRTDVNAGLRSVVRSVFTRSNRQITIPEMSWWYTRMISQGMQSWHYCTNSPFELFPALSKFIEVANLPQGQIILKHYGIGFKLIQELRKEPGDRKRANVMSVINDHPHSKFILIGDSGEQDLELYISIAQQSEQIVAIFIRNISERDRPEDWPAEDKVESAFLPTLHHTLSMPNINEVEHGRFTEDPESMFSTEKSSGSQPDLHAQVLDKRHREDVAKRSFSTADEAHASLDDFDIVLSSAQDYDEFDTRKESILEEYAKKKAEWQLRYHLAVSACPSHTFLRCFKDPKDCEQDTEMLLKLYKEELRI